MVGSLPFKISLLSEKYLSLIEKFSCKHYEIDRYVKEDALNAQNSGKGVTYLVMSETEDTIIAYYTISATTLMISKMKK